jgi:opacity protein-like surface antigen
MLIAPLLAPAAAMAQLVPGLPISVELRTGAALPMGDFGQESPGLGAGIGVGAALALHVELAWSFAAYGSYGYERFTCGACGAAGFAEGLPEAGFEVGIEWTLPLRLGGLDPWLGAGALVGRRLEIPDGGDGFASDSATGWSAGVGVRVPLAASLRLLPGIRYRSYSARFDFPDLGFGLGGDDPLEQEMNVTSVAFEVGLSYEL